MSSRIVLFFPGILGTELADGETTIWPPSPGDVLSQKKYVTRLHGATRIGEPIKDAYCQSAYGKLLRNLSRFEELHLDDGVRVFPIGYDWRPSITRIAHNVDKAVQRLLSREAPRSAEIYIVAHSMGGLVARLLLESKKILPSWVDRVRACLFVATPHLGAPRAAAAVIGREGAAAMWPSTVRTAVEDGVIESLVGLVPPEKVPLVQVWEETSLSGLADCSFLEAFSGAFQHDRVAHWDTLLRMRRPKGCEYYCLANANLPTVSSILARRNIVDTIQVDRLGDGTVPIYSAFIPIALNIKAPGNHRKIVGSDVVIDTLERAMRLNTTFVAMSSDQGCSALLAVVPDEPAEDSKVEFGVWPEGESELSLSVFDAAENEVTSAAVPDVEYFALEFVPRKRGWYRVELRCGAEPAETEKFFVRRKERLLQCSPANGSR